jgi:hypothetical protein
MKKSFRVGKLFMLLMLIIGFADSSVFASTGYIYYSDGPWRGMVIDAETKQPIEGAVVVAVWRKVYPHIIVGHSHILDAKEVLTDNTGKFLMPKFRKFNFIPLASIEGPTFEIFKPGYTTFGEYEYFAKHFPQSPLRVDNDSLAGMFKKGVVIELLKLKTREERGMNIPGGPTDIGSDRLPLLYELINEERRNLGFEGEAGRKR